MYYHNLWNIITRATSENTHHQTTTTSENILFVNTQDFINHILGKAIQFRLRQTTVVGDRTQTIGMTGSPLSTFKTTKIKLKLQLDGSNQGHLHDK